MPQCVIWDFDGVILDSLAVRDYGFREILRGFERAHIEELIAYHHRNGGLSRFHKIAYFFDEIVREPISDDEVARYAAIRTGLVKFYTYLIAGTTAGISALLFGGRLNSVSSTSAGQSYELDAIAAVIIGGSSMNGGKASIWGTLAGILILGIVSNVLDMWGISVTLQGTVKGLVIIIAVMMQRKTLK